ncbi:MAG: Gfo/Idh/MocA family oxidoreductase [Paracoccaceae bacterium]|nr:Gfo/Idh/MocA family oxidoreductase [Paracoccaceae bacterium]
MRVAIIGMGARMATLAPRFAAANDAFRVTAVADPAPARVNVLTELGFEPDIYPSAQELLTAASFDLLMIGSVNRQHLDHLRLALQSDIPHIFVEKPVVISEAETLELARLAAQHDGRGRLIVGLVLRYSPLYRLLRDAQSKGQLGEIMSIEASEHIAPYHGSFFMRDWRRDSTVSGGFLLEKCCHDLDLYQGLLGCRPLRISSFGGRKKFLPEERPAVAPGCLSEMSPRWGGIDDAFSGAGDIVDHQCALAQYENGAVMAFHTNLNVADEFRRFAVIGTRGMAEGDFIRDYFRVTDAATGTRLVDIPEVASGSNKDHYGADAAMVRDVLDFIDGGQTGLPLSYIDALEAGVTALAMDRARISGNVVDLSAFWRAFDEVV